MSTLRTYGPIARRSEKVKAAETAYQAVYRLVDARSDGRCEFSQIPEWGPLLRCTRPARDHHHLYKPRRSHHDSALIVHLCRFHHERCEWPYHRGRLVISLRAGQFVFAFLFAADKFALRSGTTAP